MPCGSATASGSFTIAVGAPIPFTFQGITGGGGVGGNGNGTSLLLQQGVYQVSLTSFVTLPNTQAAFAVLQVFLDASNLTAFTSPWTGNGNFDTMVTGGKLIVSGSNQTLQIIANAASSGGPPSGISLGSNCYLILTKLQ